MLDSVSVGRLSGLAGLLSRLLKNGAATSTRPLVNRARGVASAAVLLALGSVGAAPAADAPETDAQVEIAVGLPLSGEGGNSFGKPSLEGIQFAIEEANSHGSGPRIGLKIYDDKTTADGAKAVADQVVASRALLVLGPAYSSQTLAAGPTYAKAGMVVLPPTATSDAITQNSTTFRVIFKNSDQAGLLATYIYRVLGLRKADVVVEDNPYGETLRTGFDKAAQRLGLDVEYFPFKDIDQAKAAARRIASDTSSPPVVFLTLDTDGAPILATLRHMGAEGPMLGDDSFGGEGFSALFADRPEERAQPGYFANGVYGIAPMILDSANADTLAFAQRFRARFGHDPDWQSAAGYDAAQLAAAAVRKAAAAGPNQDVAAMRQAVQAYLASLDSPARAIPGLLGPIWFDADRARELPIRVGRFNGNRFESAPMQIVPVSNPDLGSKLSGAVFDMGPDRYARLQRVVYTGMFINEISRVDFTRASFGADFYVWLRFAHEGGPDSADPTDINFPTMISGSFDKSKPAETGQMLDGTEYRLWRVQGEFRNDYDLHRFPFDRQTLRLSFFNARAAADRIIYALDKRAPPGGQADRHVVASAGAAMAAETTPSQASPQILTLASDTAFRNLTQWDALDASERRENLVTNSTLGDPRRTGATAHRELSGFLMTIGLERRAVATAAKTLLPLLLMTFIMFASLYFPHGLVKEKVTVAITGALSGAVLLTAINNQLGSIGYTIAVEYAFYIFFGLSILCIVSVLSAERFRTAGKSKAAVTTEFWTKIVFLLAVVATLAGAGVLLRTAGTA